MQLEKTLYCLMKPFIPSELPIRELDFERLISLVGEASKKLSMYNGILQVIPNPHILLAPLTSKEAVLSSRIEGTQVSFTELLQYEADEKLNDNINLNDVDEIINYKKAMLEAEKMFVDRPFIHLNMIKNLHSILLSGVRGTNKARGEFRKVQVYIGTVGCNIESATFVPPEAQVVLSALDNWEKYINSDIQATLIQCAVMHAQFEIIHPFLDGNGRMGRMLIPLFLFQKDYISKPVFYLSEFFESNRQEYYCKLNEITSKGKWDEWIEFFLEAIIEQSNKNIVKSKEIIELYNKKKQEFIEATHSEFAINILDSLFTKPIISSNELQIMSKITSSRTAPHLFKKLVENNLIKIEREKSGSRPTIYSFEDLILLSEK